MFTIVHLRDQLSLPGLKARGFSPFSQTLLNFDDGYVERIFGKQLCSDCLEEWSCHPFFAWPLRWREEGGFWSIRGAFGQWAIAMEDPYPDMRYFWLMLSIGKTEGDFQ